MKIETGYMPFKGFKTFYRVVGEKTDRAPLVLLHGGPGSTHNYFEVLDPLAELTHRQIVFYDQIGCGESYVEGHPELWTLGRYVGDCLCHREETARAAFVDPLQYAAAKSAVGQRTTSAHHVHERERPRGDR